MRMEGVIMDKADLFLNEYRKLEEIAVQKYGYLTDGSAVRHLSDRPEFRNIKAELDYCREVRNILAHRSRVGNDYAVEPSDKMMELLERTVSKIMYPPRAYDVAIPKSKIVCKTLDDFVRPTMMEMEKHTYTHIPILENGIVRGVFSENTLLSYLVDDGIVDIDDSLKFSDISKYLPIENHSAESFRFIPKDALLYDVKTLFEETLKNSDRIGMVFLTQNGKQAESVIGILTAWDVAAVE
jgi:CBS domain-containing protein